MKRIKTVVLLLLIVFTISLVGCGAVVYEDNIEQNNPGNTSNSGEDQLRLYKVDNTYFYGTRHERNITINFAGGSSGTKYNYDIKIHSVCMVSLCEYSAEVKLYDSNDELLQTENITCEEEINAETQFSFKVRSTEEILSKIAYVDVVLSGKTTEEPNVSVRFFSVNFNYNNGSASKKVSVRSGETLSTPNDPQKNNYLFVGWYTDKALTRKYDFSKPITGDFELYAKYELDAATITNTITRNTIKAVFKIYNKSYNTFLGIETSSSTKLGSGFCFHIQNGYCYVLTNSHVVYKEASYDKQKFLIEDYQGNEYTGYLYQNPNKSSPAVSSSYDLACIYFKLGSHDVEELTLATSNPIIDQDVISLGSPKAQSNSITYGRVLQYIKNSMVSGGSNVKFDVAYHNAYINSGSSGGPLLDADLRVVGVNYSGNPETEEGAAIPIEKVHEFLKQYVYN